MEVGELHYQLAQAALSPSFFFIRLSPDWRTVSSEASLAARAFRAADMHAKEAQALRLQVRAEDALRNPLGAGTTLAQLGDLLLKHKSACRRTTSSKGRHGAAAAAYEEAIRCYKEAVRRFKEAEQTDLAVDTLLRIAKKKEKELSTESTEEAIKAFEEALDLRMARHQFPHASEVYKHYLCMLVRVGMLRKATTVALRRAHCLFKLKQLAGVHKAILTMVVLFLALHQQNMADRILSGKEAMESSFIGTPEFTAGAEAVDAYKKRDGEALSRALEALVFRFLLPPVAALAAKMAVKARNWPGDLWPGAGEVGIPGEAIDDMLR